MLSAHEPITMSPDPFTCIGVAGSLIQIVQFLYELTSKATEIYSSGTHAAGDYLVAQCVARDLRDLLVGVESNPYPLGRPKGVDDSFEHLIDQCKSTSGELLDALDKLDRRKAKGKWASLKLALREVWAEETVELFTRRVAFIQSQVTLRLLTMLRYGPIVYPMRLGTN